MKQDDAYKKIIRREMDEAFSYLDVRPSLHGAVMRRIEGESVVKRKMSVALVFAIVLMLALCGMAVAAGLGLFGQLRATKEDETSYNRLGLLEEAAVTIGETMHLRPAQAGDAEADTTYDKLRIRQHDGEYELTIDQVYCDGRKLYYSYTYKMLGDAVQMHEGEATGFESWMKEYPGKTFAEAFPQESVWQLDAAQYQTAVDWFAGHTPGYMTVRYASVGDGADLPDGTYLNPVDNGSEMTEDGAMRAYYEVELPEGYQADERITFYLTISEIDTVYYQDETGAYSGLVMNRDASVCVPVEAQVTGESRVMTGESTAYGYPAHATLFVSDVDISGSVRIEAPEDCYPEGYVLVADGVTYRNIDEWTHFNGEAYVLGMRFDLPPTMNSLALVPYDPDRAQETITLK